MKTTIRQLFVDDKNVVQLVNISPASILLTDKCSIAIDGSTSNTGVAIIDQNKTLKYIMSFESDSADKTPVHYKLALKKELEKIIEGGLDCIVNIYYEAPTLNRKTAIPNLMMLRSTVQEILIERDWNIEYTEINNMSWKKWFLAPDKIPNGTEAQKSAVFVKLTKYMPFLSVITQDECDAICIGTYAVSKFLETGNNEEVKEKKKIKPFKFEIKFIGGDDDECLSDLLEMYNGPDRLLEEGVNIVEVKDKCKLEDEVYRAIGEEDIVAIIKMNAKGHGNVVLKYRLGNLASDFKYIYALVWRTARKRH